MSSPLSDDLPGPMRRALARTEELCAVDPLARSIRTLLLDIERKANGQGWDTITSPEVFSVTHDPQTDRIRHGWEREHTKIVRHRAEVNGGNAGEAFQMIAELSERIRRGDDFGPLVGPNPFRNVAPDQDVIPGGQPGWRFYGYGVINEAWSTPLHVVSSSAMQAGANHRLHRHPDRQELRIVYFSPRDGTRWSVIRHRGAQPIAFLTRPEGGTQESGGIPNALARMTNAVVGNPVPIPPVRGRNPLFRQPPF